MHARSDSFSVECNRKDWLLNELGELAPETRLRKSVLTAPNGNVKT